MISFRSLRTGAALFAATSLLYPAAVTALEDAPPVDMAQILQALKTLRDQQVQQVKASKMRTMQEAQALAANPGRAADTWEDAVRAIQFDGASKEAQQFRDWKDREGDALRAKECQNALRLHFTWLGLTVQHAAGATIKDMLPAVINYTKDVTADQVAMQAFEENMKREKELEASRKHGPGRKSNDDQIKRMHDQILTHSVASSPVAKWMHLEETVKSDEKWEMTPGNVDGIFQSIILPELRKQKDPRVIEYWDMKIRLGADSATKARLNFDAERFNNVTRPQLLWNRAQDMILLGQRNRAINEMFSLVKSYPNHPDFTRWLGDLEQVLMPSADAAPAGAAPASAAAPAPTAPVAPAATATGAAPARPR